MNETANQPLLEVKGLCKSFGNLEVLKSIDQNIYKGEKVAVIGPSGSGKSTFLRCLNCMEDPTGGSIFFGGEDLADMKVDINKHRENIGMVFQQFNLFNNKTVIENIMLAPVHLRIKKAGGLGIFCHPYWLSNVHQVPENITDYMLKTHPFDAFEVLGGENYYEQNGLQTHKYYEVLAKGYDLFHRLLVIFHVSSGP